MKTSKTSSKKVIKSIPVKNKAKDLSTVLASQPTLVKKKVDSVIPVKVTSKRQVISLSGSSGKMRPYLKPSSKEATGYIHKGHYKHFSIIEIVIILCVMPNLSLIGLTESMGLPEFTDSCLSKHLRRYGFDFLNIKDQRHRFWVSQERSFSESNMSIQSKIIHYILLCCHMRSLTEVESTLCEPTTASYQQFSRKLSEDYGISRTKIFDTVIFYLNKCGLSEQNPMDTAADLAPEPNNNTAAPEANEGQDEDEFTTYIRIEASTPGHNISIDNLYEEACTESIIHPSDEADDLNSTDDATFSSLATDDLNSIIDAPVQTDTPHSRNSKQIVSPLSFLCQQLYENSSEVAQVTPDEDSPQFKC